MLLTGFGVYYWQKSSTPVIPKTVNNPPQEQKSNTNNTTDKCDVCDELPVVIFSPGGLFSEPEKIELQAKLIDPFFDYENSDEINFVVMMISKEQDPVESGFTYIVDAVGLGGIHLGFIYGSETSEIDWWAPTCMGPCPIPAGYKEKYPEVVKLIDANN